MPDPIFPIDWNRCPEADMDSCQKKCICCGAGACSVRNGYRVYNCNEPCPLTDTTVFAYQHCECARIYNWEPNEFGYMIFNSQFNYGGSIRTFAISGAPSTLRAEFSTAPFGSSGADTFFQAYGDRNVNLGCLPNPYLINISLPQVGTGPAIFAIYDCDPNPSAVSSWLLNLYPV